MSTDSDFLHKLPIDSLKRIHQACRAFEAAWKQGEPPSLEKCLGTATDAERAAMLHELLVIEIHHRRRRGEEPSENTYGARFPADAAVVTAAFRLPSEASSSQSGGDPVVSLGDPKPLQPGCRIGNYELVEKIGGGGMGRVFLAKDLAVGGRHVALKQICDVEPELAAQMRDRFKVEVKNLSLLSHPRIVRILNAGYHLGDPYLVMDYIRGRDLAAFRDECSTLPLETRLRRLLQVLIEVADAVDYAHRRNIAHRDLKPGNILVASKGDEPMVVDFGLSKCEGSDRITSTGRVIGTPSFLAPEQVDPKLLGLPRLIDVWAFGVVLYWACTGTLPFQGNNAAALSFQILRGTPRRPRELESAIPPLLEKVILACLNKAAAQRPQRLAVVAGCLRRVLSALPETPAGGTLAPGSEKAQVGCAAARPEARAGTPVVAASRSRSDPRSRRALIPLVVSSSLVLVLLAATAWGLWNRSSGPGPVRQRSVDAIAAFTATGSFSAYHVPASALEVSTVRIPIESTCRVESLELRSPSTSSTPQPLPMRLEPGSVSTVVAIPSYYFEVDGEYSLLVALTCDDGGSVSASKTILVRRVASPADELDPAPDQVLGARSGHFKGRVQDPHCARVYLGLTELSRDREGRFTAPFDTTLMENCTVPEGLEHCVILHPLRIEDNFGNVHTQAVVYLVDDEQPAFRFTFVNGLPIDDATSQGGVVQVLAGQETALEYDVLDPCHEGRLSFSMGLADGEPTPLPEARPGSDYSFAAPANAGYFRLVGQLSHRSGAVVEKELRFQAISPAEIASPAIMIFNSCQSVALRAGQERPSEPLRWSPPAFLAVRPTNNALTGQGIAAIAGLDFFCLEDTWYARLGAAKAIGTLQSLDLDLGRIKGGVKIVWQGTTQRKCTFCDSTRLADCPDCDGGAVRLPGRLVERCLACKGGKIPCTACENGYEAAVEAPELLARTIQLEQAWSSHAKAAAAQAECERAMTRAEAELALARKGPWFRTLPGSLGDLHNARKEYWRGRTSLFRGAFEQAVARFESAREGFEKYDREAIRGQERDFQRRLANARNRLLADFDAKLDERYELAWRTLAAEVERCSGAAVSLAVSRLKAGTLPLSVRLDVATSCLDASGELGGDALQRIALAAESLLIAKAGGRPAAASVEVRFPDGWTTTLFPETLLVLKACSRPLDLLNASRAAAVSE